MTRTSLLALCAAGALALAACGQQAQQQAELPAPAPVETATPAGMTDAEFVQAALNADAFEIQSSQLAAQRADRADVKTLAATLVTENTAATQALTSLAPTLQITVPAPAVATDQADDLADLNTKTGEAFDDAYLDDQVEAHNNAIALYERYVASASEGPLKQWAQTELAEMRTHRDQVQALENAT